MEASARENIDMVHCPYDFTHRVSKFKLNTHLTKCRKNYLKSNFVQCKYNTNHVIPAQELQHHNETCCDRYRFEMPPDKNEINVANQYPLHKIDVSTEESWDNYNAATYNPKEYCKKNKVVVKIAVASASTRKEFRMAERRRLNDLEYLEYSSKSRALSNKNRPARETQPITDDEWLGSSSFGKENHQPTSPITPTRDDWPFTRTSTPIVEKFADMDIAEEEKSSSGFILVTRKGKGRKLGKDL